MSIRSLKSELRWTRILLGGMFLLCALGYASTNGDYSKFRLEKEEIKMAVKQSAIDNFKEISKLRSSIMPSAFKGRR